MSTSVPSMSRIAAGGMGIPFPRTYVHNRPAVRTAAALGVDNAIGGHSRLAPALLLVVLAPRGRVAASLPRRRLAEQACPAANATPAHASKREIVRATLCGLNRERAHAGLRKLKLNTELSRAARRHAHDMARRNYFSHDTLGGGSFVDRIRARGLPQAARTAGSSARTSPGAAAGTRGRA